MEICGLQKVTLIDFPGQISCAVFLGGCNLRCPWCYSKELVLPEAIARQPKIPEKEFFDFLKQRKGLLEGVVICGGEPTTNRDLLAFIKKIKSLGYLVKLDTNGSNPKILKDLIGQIDYVAMDVKLPKERYQEVLQVDAKNIEASINILKEGGTDYEFRTTVVPTIHAKEDILQIAKWLSPAKRYYLQNFRPEKTIDPTFEKLRPYPDEELLEIHKAISPFFETCGIR